MGFTKMLGLWEALVRKELKGEEKKVSVNNRNMAGKALQLPNWCTPTYP